LVKAWIERTSDGLVIVTTEFNQKAVVPESSLCDLLARYHLEVVNEEVRCERIEVKAGGAERYLEEDT